MSDGKNANDEREKALQAEWLRSPVRCDGNIDPPCGWLGVGADIVEWEECGEIPCCPNPACNSGIVELILPVDAAWASP